MGEINWLQAAKENPDEILEQLDKTSTFERLPSVSIAPRTIIAVKFLSEPQERGIDSYGRQMVWADVEMLLETDQGYDRENKKPMKLKVGDKASINLNRHASLLSGAQRNAPLTGKKFIIANMGKRRTQSGRTAMVYRWKELV